MYSLRVLQLENTQKCYPGLALIIFCPFQTASGMAVVLRSLTNRCDETIGPVFKCPSRCKRKKKEKCITTFPLVNLQQISGLVASLKRQHASVWRFWKHDAIYSCHLPLGAYMGTTTGSLQCFLRPVKRGLVTMLVRFGSLSGCAWSNKE